MGETNEKHVQVVEGLKEGESVGPQRPGPQPNAEFKNEADAAKKPSPAKTGRRFRSKA